MPEIIRHDEYGDPILHFTTGGRQVDSGIEATKLYLHEPEHAGIDHIFIMTDPENGRGMFLWRTVIDEHVGSFDDLATDMIEEGFDWVQEIPAGCDIASYERYMDNETPKVTNQMIDEAIREWKGE